MNSHSSRRTFLRSLSATLGAPLLGQWAALDEAFARALDTATRPGDALPSAADLRSSYLLDPTVHYFNHASIGTVPSPVHAAGTRYREICEENPWLYIWGGAWEEAREDVRRSAAQLLGCSPDDLAITHNTTEGFNCLAQGLPLGPGDEVLFSSLNHPGASLCWDHFAQAMKYSVRRFEFPLVDVPGLTLQDVVRVHEEQIREETRALVLPHLDNIVGLRHPLRELATMARSRGVEYVLVDGAQSAGMLPVDLSASGVDAFATSPHKWLQSPKGLGLLYVRPRLRDVLRPMWVTFGQARWEGTARVYEDYGTRDLPDVLTLGAALDFQRSLGQERKVQRYRQIFGVMRDGVEATPTLEWRSPREWAMGGVLMAVQLLESRADAAAEDLFQSHGIVLRAFSETGLNSLRVSPNLMNSDQELQDLLTILGGNL